MGPTVIFWGVCVGGSERLVATCEEKNPFSDKSFEVWLDKAVISDQRLPRSNEQLCNYAFESSSFKDR